MTKKGAQQLASVANDLVQLYERILCIIVQIMGTSSEKERERDVITSRVRRAADRKLGRERGRKKVPL